MDIIATPEEYAEGKVPGSVMTPEGRQVLIDGLGKKWATNLTFGLGPTIDEDLAHEIVAAELKYETKQRHAQPWWKQIWDRLKYGQIPCLQQ